MDIAAFNIVGILHGGFIVRRVTKNDPTAGSKYVVYVFFLCVSDYPLI